MSGLTTSTQISTPVVEKIQPAREICICWNASSWCDARNRPDTRLCFLQALKIAHCCRSSPLHFHASGSKEYERMFCFLQPNGDQMDNMKNHKTNNRYASVSCLTEGRGLDESLSAMHRFSGASGHALFACLDELLRLGFPSLEAGSHIYRPEETRPLRDLTTGTPTAQNPNLQQKARTRKRRFSVLSPPGEARLQA